MQEAKFSITRTTSFRHFYDNVQRFTILQYASFNRLLNKKYTPKEIAEQLEKELGESYFQRYSSSVDSEQTKIWRIPLDEEDIYFISVDPQRGIDLEVTDSTGKLEAFVQDYIQKLSTYMHITTEASQTS